MPRSNSFSPVDSNTFARPVTIGDVAGLFGVETPEGRGILFWSTGRYMSTYPLGGQSLFYAEVDSPQQFPVDGVINSEGQIHLIDIDGAVDSNTYGGTSVPTGNIVPHPNQSVENNHVGRPSVSMIGGKLYLAISLYYWRVMETRVFVCENPDVFPLEFTRVGDISADELPVDWFKEPGATYGDLTDWFVYPYPASGTFYEISETRIAYVGGWMRADGPRYRFGVWHSDDGGASWANGVSATFPLGFTSHGYQAPQIEYDHTSERFFFTQYAVTSTTLDVWASADGASWSKAFSQSGGSTSLKGHGVVSDPWNAYVLRNLGGVYRLTDLDTWTMEQVASVGTGAGLMELQMARRALVTVDGHAYYFYEDDRVSSLVIVSTGGWVVGAIGFNTPDLCA